MDGRVPNTFFSPALRDKSSNDALWKGIANGVIKTIGSDHCPFNFHGIKEMNGKDDYRKVPGGAPGLKPVSYSCILKE